MHPRIFAPPLWLPRASPLAVALLLALLPAAVASAQRADSARVAPAGARADSAPRARLKPPLSPRRAFLYSLAVPGYSQSVLGRPTAGGLFVLTESIAIAMLRESAAGVRQARRFMTDSLVVVGYETNGTPIRQASPWTQELLDTRRAQVEDWIAFIIANHLFAAADAYVGAHLWDLPSQISVRPGPSGTVVAARVRW